MIDRIAGAPLDPDVAEEVHRLYLARGALATTAIEGNTLSEAEARAVIDDRATLPPSRAYLGREIRNIVEACNMVAGEIAGQGRFPLSVVGVERLNAMVLQGLEVDDHVEPGKVRQVNVSVGGYRCPDRRDAGFLLARLCEVLNEFPLPDENRYAFSILKAVFAHLYFVWIHPFGDGNGRTARLIELAILLEAGLPQPACHLPSNHYNLTRTEYYRQLVRASGQEDGIYGFASYAIRGFADGLREQVEVIREHQRGGRLGQFRPRAIRARRRRHGTAAPVPGACPVAAARGGSGQPPAVSGRNGGAGLRHGIEPDAAARCRGPGAPRPSVERPGRRSRKPGAHPRLPALAERTAVLRNGSALRQRR